MIGKQEKPRIVVTGLGVVHGLGEGIEPFWKALLEGRSGVGRVSSFDPAGYTCQVGAEVPAFEIGKYMDPKEARRNDLYTQYALAASKLAVEDARLDTDSLEHERFGVVVGSGIGGMRTIETQVRNCFEKGPRKVSPFMIPSLISNMAGGIIAIAFNAQGPNHATVSACATASHAVGDCMRMMQVGDADIMIAGGSEAAITQVGFAGFCSMKAMSTSYNETPERSSRPFDKGRDGFVMGEGAGILILETEAHARARGARIYCELAGYGSTCDAHHITMPEPEGRGLSNAMKLAVSESGEALEAVDYINAHGTSTPYNDKFETAAIKRTFGDHAHQLKISSTKSMTGHLLGAAGGIEAAACIKAIETGWIAPTINYEDPDPECDLDYVPNQPAEHPVRVALNNNSGFGGHNTALLFRRWEG